MSNILVFPGQGSQYIGMLKDVYDKYSKAKEVFKTADDVLSFSLSKLIFEGEANELQATYNAQPALLVSSIAMLNVLESEYGFSVENASYIAGHSLGEYTALVAGGVISLQDGIALVRKRGELMEKAYPQGKGAMAAVIGLDLEKVQELAEGVSVNGETCVVANDNSVGQVVVSGSTKAVDEIVATGKEKGARMVVKLQTSGPFHSPLMQDASLELKEALDALNFSNSKVGIIHNYSANILQNANEIKDMLVKQLSSRVRWRESILFATQNGVSKQIEIGPSKVLTGLSKRIDKSLKAVNFEKEEDILNNLKELEN